MLGQLNAKLDMIIEGMQALSAQIATQQNPTIQKDTSIVLPKIPLVQVDELVRLNLKLMDGKFRDQMVRYI